MKIYVPPKLGHNAPLLVVLHGCLQTPESLDAGSGFSRLADRRGFAVLSATDPEQQCQFLFQLVSTEFGRSRPRRVDVDITDDRGGDSGPSP
jgi:poly(3-hydroxybutyrate) depolymerase